MTERTYEPCFNCGAPTSAAYDEDGTPRDLRLELPLTEAEVYVISGEDIHPSMAHELRERWKDEFPDKRLLVLGGKMKIEPLSHLDAAWREAEAALPENWHGPSLWHEDKGWCAAAVEHSLLRPMPVTTKGHGTPAAALRDLAAKLRER